MDQSFWDKQIDRATELAEQSTANELLVFYASVLAAQRDIYDFLVMTRSEPSSDLRTDLKLLVQTFPILWKAIEQKGSPQLQNEMQSLKASTAAAIFNLLLEYSNQRSPTQFFAKALFQPYGRWRWESGAAAIASHEHEGRFCPYCNGLPQVSYLELDASSESVNRNLICATCLFCWSFRRGVCVNCGEESPSKLVYFQADQHKHIKVESCETCRSYIKSIDLTQLGIAAPLVDDISSAALDLWASENRYAKLEINLVGL